MQFLTQSNSEYFPLSGLTMPTCWNSGHTDQQSSGNKINENRSLVGHASLWYTYHNKRTNRILHLKSK